jgi:hypothetical protein
LVKITIGYSSQFRPRLHDRLPMLAEFGIVWQIASPLLATQKILFERDNSSGGPTSIEAESWGNGEAREPTAGI